MFNNHKTVTNTEVIVYDLFCLLFCFFSIKAVYDYSLFFIISLCVFSIGFLIKDNKINKICFYFGLVTVAIITLIFIDTPPLAKSLLVISVLFLGNITKNLIIDFLKKNKET